MRTMPSPGFNAGSLWSDGLRRSLDAVTDRVDKRTHVRVMRGGYLRIVLVPNMASAITAKP
jgi:pectin methylesterase-like acyl-CoA thioesterase